ncbi:MAG: protoporphyrinogen oxidase [Acidimicrobiales bacterium]
MAPTAPVVVVGGGIAGLAAAWDLVGLGVPVTVVEADGRLGGKIRTQPFAGVDLDRGADAFVVRAPEDVWLCREVGLADRLVPSAAATASVWARGRLRRLPAGLVLGVPTAPLPLARSRILSPLGMVRAGLDLVVPPRRGAGDNDEAVGKLVRRRLGAQAHELLVDPLVGGINAGDSDRLSLAVTAPALADAARHRSLVLGARALRRTQVTGGPAAAPASWSLAGGLGTLVARLARRLGDAGARVRTATRAEALVADGDGWVVEVTGTRGVPDRLGAAAVVLATPAHATAELLAPLVPEAAATLAGVEHASVAVVAMAYPPGALRRPPGDSGFLVPRREGWLMTACSWASAKWPHLAVPGQELLRVSAGRHRDPRPLDLDDGPLVERLHHELDQVVGATTGPSAWAVTRWERAFPQFAPGHLRRVAGVEAALAARLPGLALAGAAVSGAGIPACIASGRRAAASVGPRAGAAARHARR